MLIGDDHEEGPVDLLRLFEAPAEEFSEALLLLRGQRGESREPPVRDTVQGLGLPDDGRHSCEDPLGLLLQSFLAELPIEPLGEVGQMGGVEGGIVELLLRQGTQIPTGALQRLLEGDAEVGVQELAEGKLPTAEERRGAVVFLILALVAFILGARGIAGFSMEIAKWLVIIFVVVAIVTFLL